MKQIFTPNHLVKLLYRETSDSEARALEAAVEESVELKEKYEALSRAFRELPRVRFNPSTASLEKILSHSAHMAIEEQA